MDSYFVAVGSAIWLGILTSLSPCPLATNIAAITYIGKRVDRPGAVLLSGMVYTLGRTISYVALGFLVVTSALSIPTIALFLQQNMNKFLGPILLVAGVFLLGIFKFALPDMRLSDSFTARVDRWGIGGAGILGLLFALSFCPVSAALFFGSLIPLAVERQSSVLIPTLYGIGTALPVVVFAVLIAVGARFVGVMYNKLTVFEKWARRITGTVFLLLGVYYILVYLVGWQFP